MRSVSTLGSRQSQHTSVIPPSMLDAASRHPLSAAFLLGASLPIAFGAGALGARSLLRLCLPAGVRSAALERSQSVMQWHRGVQAALARTQARLEKEVAALAEKRAFTEELERQRAASLEELRAEIALLRQPRAEMAQGGLAGHGQSLAESKIKGQASEPWGWIKDRQRAAAGAALADPSIDVLQGDVGQADKGITRAAIINLPGPAATLHEVDDRALSPLASSLPGSASVDSTAETKPIAKKPVNYELLRKTYIPQYGGLRAGIGRHGPLPIVDPSNPNYK